jgi:2-oxoglutarate dehydrogenase E2 component (dihydrolipoamide succinyltransferase)
MDVTVPRLAEAVTEGDIARWLKQNGERVEKDEALVELETDKATVELTAEASGVLEIVVPEGRTVHVGDVIARIAEGGEAKAEPATPAKPEEQPPAAEKPAAAPENKAPAPPREVAPPASAEPPGEPAPTPAEPGTRRVRMSRLRRRIAERLVEAQQTAAILTTFNEIDMTEVLALRQEHQERFEKEHGVKLGFMSFFARASVLALRDIPEINAAIEGEEIVYHDSVHLGIAVGTPRGLVVPVVRDADRLSFGEIERRIREFATKARDGDIAIEDLQGGTFTISNGGIYGSLLSTPILNPPQSGILGMHKIERRPVTVADPATGERFRPRVRRGGGRSGARAARHGTGAGSDGARHRRRDELRAPARGGSLHLRAHSVRPLPEGPGRGSRLGGGAGADGGRPLHGMAARRDGVRFQSRPERAARVSRRRRPGDSRVGGRRGGDEGRRPAEARDPAGARIRRGGRRRGDPAQRDAGVRHRAARNPLARCVGWRSRPVGPSGRYFATSFPAGSRR